MKLVAILTVSLTVAFSAGVAIGATSPWRVLAKAENESTSFSYASANVDVNRPKGLRIRAFGSAVELGGSFSCQLADSRRVQSGQAIVLSIGIAKSCSVYANATAQNGGKLRVLIEGR